MNMELGLGNSHLAGDPRLVDHIVGEVKSQGIFDQFRKECIADVDTKPAYQNLRTRVESSVNSFLGKQTWKADLNKNQLRETLRKHIVEAPYLDAGVERIVDQVVNPKVYSVFMPQIEDVVYKFLGLERPRNRQRNGPCGFKDLLPKDLDPVSPESDKNSLKDVSLDSVDAGVVDSEPQDKESSINNVEQSVKDDPDNSTNDKDNNDNGCHVETEIKSTEDAAKPSPIENLNNTAKSEEKTEEEEEDSPTFEPIDIMNLNESNVSNDSHLSGISELTSHRSRSPDFSNDLSRDNMDFSNQDSQFSKVSSDSRLSIVTDFGSSNHGSTPVSDVLKDDKNESKNPKDNFRAVREFEVVKANKDVKSTCETLERSKENTPSDFKHIRRSFSSKETSRDGMDSATKDSQRNDSKSRKSDSKDSKKDRDKDNRRKSTNHEARSFDKSSKKNSKDRTEEKSRERDKDKDKDKKEPEKKDKIEVAKEVKDLKDLYKEKIRELREKKELTEKEKLIRDKDSKTSKEGKEKRDSSRDKRDSKDHKSSSSKSSNRSESKNSKSTNSNETKPVRSESRDKNKRDDRRSSKDNKTKIYNSQSDDKSDGKRISRSDEKMEKSNVKETKDKTTVKKDVKNVDKRDSKNETEKDKKRRDEKKTKMKDDHSSLRKNSEDRRSTDRDGSNGSNGKSSQRSGSSSSGSVAKSSSSNNAKESTNTSNSSSETSDSIEESHNEKLRISVDSKNVEIVEKPSDHEFQAKKLDLGQNEICLPIKKRPFGDGCVLAGNLTEISMKKPKFAKNFQEAKRLMKIRRKIEKEKLRREQEIMKTIEIAATAEIRENVDKNDDKNDNKNDLELVPDDERVQIIEVCDEEYDEPYPEMRSDFTLEERSQIILGGESIFTSDLPINPFNVKSTLSEMELSIRESLNEMISDKNVEDADAVPKTKQTTSDESEIKINETIESSKEIKINETIESSKEIKINETIESAKEILLPEPKNSSDTEKTLTMDSTESKRDEPEVDEVTLRCDDNVENNEKKDEENNERKDNEENNEKNVKEENNEKKDEEEDNKMNDNEKKDEEEDNEMKDNEKKDDDEISTKDESIISKNDDSKIAEISKSSENNDEVENKIFDEIIETSKASISEFQPPTETIVPEVVPPQKIETEPCESISKNTTETCNNSQTNLPNISTIIEEDPAYLSDDVPCLYFTRDNDRLDKFTKFMKDFENDEESSNLDEEIATADLTNLSGVEDAVSSLSKSMAPPKPKRKYSTSPLTDILLNNTNNNNDAHKITSTIAEDENPTNCMKKRKLGRPKKERSSGSLCGQNNLLNGENFVMPLSPESDVSATSEKTPSNPPKDEKSRPRGSNQRYTSDDLYKPRPLFASSSRRSRRSNPA